MDDATGEPLPDAAVMLGLIAVGRERADNPVVVVVAAAAAAAAAADGYGTAAPLPARSLH